jgi:hypothetical protein
VQPKWPLWGHAFLFAVSRALARLHVEHDDPRRMAGVRVVDPPSGQIGKSGGVLRPSQPLGLKTAHLDGRGGRPRDRPVADRPAHRRVTAQLFGVIHVLIAGRRPNTHWRSKVATVLACASIGAGVGQADVDADDASGISAKGVASLERQVLESPLSRGGAPLGTALRPRYRPGSSVAGGKAAAPRGCGIFSP